MKFFFRDSCRGTQNDVERPEKQFTKKIRADVCVCVV